jgi:hypothetical protein
VGRACRASTSELGEGAPGCRGAPLSLAAPVRTLRGEPRASGATARTSRATRPPAEKPHSAARDARCSVHHHAALLAMPLVSSARSAACAKRRERRAFRRVRARVCACLLHITETGRHLQSLPRRAAPSLLTAMQHRTHWRRHSRTAVRHDISTSASGALLRSRVHSAQHAPPQCSPRSVAALP